MSDELVNRRNTESIKIKLQEMDERLYKMDEQCMYQQGQINLMMVKIASLENELRLQKAMSFGTGASVKG